MPLAKILSTDKLQSGFRAKFNANVDLSPVSYIDNGNGSYRVTFFSGSFIDIALTDSFYTQTEVDALIAAIAPPDIQKTIIEKTQADIEFDAAINNWYVEYKDEDGNAIADGIMPYSIITTYVNPDDADETITDPIAPLLSNRSTWDFPRIYGFPDPATDQIITIQAI